MCSLFPDQTVVEVPAGRGEEIVAAMTDSKICGRPVKAEKLASSVKAYRDTPKQGARPYSGTDIGRSSFDRKKPYRPR